MKQKMNRFRCIPAAAGAVLLLSSTGAGYANAADSTEDPIAAARSGVRQVQQLAEKLYDENLERFASRNGGYTWDTERKSRSWTYYNGIMTDAYLMLDDCTANSVRAYAAVNAFYDANITETDTGAAVDTTGNSDNYYRENELDSIPPVRALFDLLRSDVPTEAEREKYTRMILWVYEIMTDTYPTVDGTDGNFRHKYGNVSSSWVTYPVALDGLYMATPFFTELANAVEDGVIDGTDAEIDPDRLYAEAAARMYWVGTHLYDEETGLYHHGWGPDAGVNGQFWLRAVGWYAAALADVISMLPERFSEQREKLIAVETQLFDGMMQYRDAETGMWYNVIDRDGTLRRSSNYNLPESSGSALIAYAMLKSYAEGFLDRSYGEAGLHTFSGIVRTQLDGEGLHNIYLSSGVGTTAESYLANGYKVNEAKGVGPLMMAACYAERAAVLSFYEQSGIRPDGDVDANGKVQAADLVLLQKWLLALPDTALPDWNAADLNKDGKLNGADLTLLKRLLLAV